MRRTWIIVCVVAFGLVLAVEFVPIYRCLWVGGYDLAVNIDKSDDPPAMVGCFGMIHRDEADRFCSLSPDPREFGRFESRSFADPYTGQPLKVHIRTTGQTSAFGRELGRHQQRFLVVNAEWRDGRRACKVVKIPDGRESREVRVSLP